MKKLLFFSIFWIAISPWSHGQTMNPEPIAISIVYDTSGSMSQLVKDSSGKMAPKYVIANRALLAVIKRLQTVADDKSSARPISCGLVVFTERGAREAIPFGPLKSEEFSKWVQSFNKPSGATPLGEAIRTAAHSLQRAKARQQHLLVITDGMNTFGIAPESVLPQLQRASQKTDSALSVYFVAFDVAAKVFEPIKNQGALVVSAADEKELSGQLNVILEENILLEADEPTASSVNIPTKK